MIADESQVRVYYVEDAKSVYESPIAVISGQGKVLRAALADNGQNLIVAWQTKNQQGKNETNLQV